MNVKLKIVQIGNSQGLRLPKLLLEQCGIKKEVEAEAVDGAIILRPLSKGHRKGWDQAFLEMSKQGDDKISPEILIDFDESQWQWK